MKTTKSKRIVLLILGIVVFLVAAICLIIHSSKIHEKQVVEQQKKLVFKDTTGLATINEIYIYGMHLNIKGEVDALDEIELMELVLFNKDERRKYNLEYEYQDDKIRFYLSNEINSGIYLDDINIGEYQLLLKVSTKNGAKYYNLYNSTKYTYMDYYTITRNGKNNYIEINSLVDNTVIKVIEKNLPKGVYDITVDAGHGGEDPGAVKNNVYESYINLEVSLKVKKELESLGLKVKLTRTGDYNPGNIEGISPYGDGGRISIGYETKSKLFLSIHSNNLPTNPRTNGVEIYTSEFNNKKLATLFADNIVKETGINYSSGRTWKIRNGVYVRNLSVSEINSFKKDAIKDGYKFYEDINTSTQYYYVIRETGGMITNAYMDGRNKNYKPNKYYNSNIGLDGYLIEMGYITNSNDLSILLNKKDSYARAIKNSIKNYLNITN